MGKSLTQGHPVLTGVHSLCRAEQSAPQRRIPQEGQPEESSLELQLSAYTVIGRLLPALGFPWLREEKSVSVPGTATASKVTI